MLTRSIISRQIKSSISNKLIHHNYMNSMTRGALLQHTGKLKHALWVVDQVTLQDYWEEGDILLKRRRLMSPMPKLNEACGELQLKIDNLAYPSSKQRGSNDVEGPQS